MVSHVVLRVNLVVHVSRTQARDLLFIHLHISQQLTRNSRLVPWVMRRTDHYRLLCPLASQEYGVPRFCPI